MHTGCSECKKITITECLISVCSTQLSPCVQLCFLFFACKACFPIKFSRIDTEKNYLVFSEQRNYSKLPDDKYCVHTGCIECKKITITECLISVCSIQLSPCVQLCIFFCFVKRVLIPIKFSRIDTEKNYLVFSEQRNYSKLPAFEQSIKEASF